MVLLIYGFHKEEARFTEQLVRPFGSIPDYTVYQVTNPVSYSTKGESAASREISSLIEDMRPDCVIDVHHSFGDLNAIDADVARSCMEADPAFADIYLWTFPLVYFLENPTDGLEAYMREQGIGVHFYDYFPRQHIPSSRVAVALDIPYVGLEANVNTLEGVVVRDAMADNAVRASREFIENVHRYMKKK